MMLLRARSLAMGYSGARPEVAEAILDVLNAGITPVVPEHGSLGASGDLAPLAHCALALIGEGEVLDVGGGAPPRRRGARRGRDRAAHAAREGGPGADQRHRRHPRHAGARRPGPAFAAAGRRPDGRDVGGGAARDRSRVRRGPDRPAPTTGAGGRAPPTCAACSPARRSSPAHREDDPRVQDAYSLRCAPQVNGAARDALAYADGVAAEELRSAIDNPMVLPDGRVESCGNFHGAPLALACDLLAMAVADTGAIAERRTDRLARRQPAPRVCRRSSPRTRESIRG